MAVGVCWVMVGVCWVAVGVCWVMVGVCWVAVGVCGWEAPCRGPDPALRQPPDPALRQMATLNAKMQGLGL